MRRLFAALILSLVSALAATAEPSVKIINFTADWCPNCQILNPRIGRSYRKAFEDRYVFVRVDLDVTRDSPTYFP